MALLQIFLLGTEDTLMGQQYKKIPWSTRQWFQGCPLCTHTDPSIENTLPHLQGGKRKIVTPANTQLETQSFPDSFSLFRVQFNFHLLQEAFLTMRAHWRAPFSILMAFLGSTTFCFCTQYILTYILGILPNNRQTCKLAVPPLCSPTNQEYTN